MSEITKRDRAHNTVQKNVIHYFGRGSKVMIFYDSESVFRLCSKIGKFWRVATPRGKLGSLHENQIEKILVDGHWVNFDPKDRNWKKV